MPLIRTVSILFFVSVLTISCNNTAKVINETASLSKAQIEGKVLDDETNEPIGGAEIWVEGTTIKSVSNEEGIFSIKVPRGNHELYAMAGGYHAGSASVSIQNIDAKVHDFMLTRKASRGNYSYSVSGNATDYNSESASREINAKIDSLENVITVLEDKLKGGEEVVIEREEVKKFIDQFINHGLKCSLMNPEDLSFADAEKGTLWINEPVELVVMNNELGYKVTIKMKEFVSQEYSEIIGLNVDASYFFEELEPESEEQAKTWEEKRNRYFRGSLRHFLIAMASDKSPLFFGYRFYSGQFVSNTTAMAYSSSNVSDVEKQKYEIIFPNNLNGNNILKFDGELRVEYVERGVEDPNNIMGLNMYKYQTSWLSLNSQSVEFSDTGFFESPRAVDLKGVWRYTPVCKMLPGDYLPEYEQ